MNQRIKTQKGFIQIPILIAMIIITMSAGVSVVLYKQGKLNPLIASISQVFEGTEDIKPEIKSKESQPEEEQSLLEEINQIEDFQAEQELEQAKLEAEKAKQEAERAKAEIERLKAEQEFQEQLNLESENQELGIKSCSSGLILCNDKCWEQCFSEQTFHCPEKGDPFCCDGIVCNDVCWKPCPSGQELHCPSQGNAECKVKSTSELPYFPSGNTSNDTDFSDIKYLFNNEATIISYDSYDEESVFLGKITSKYDNDSVLNRYGNYGSKYSSDSIWNKYGEYGGKYSSESPFNKYTSDAPRIYVGDTFWGHLSRNKYISSDTINPNDLLMFAYLKYDDDRYLDLMITN